MRSISILACVVIFGLSYERIDVGCGIFPTLNIHAPLIILALPYLLTAVCLLVFVVRTRSNQEPNRSQSIGKKHFIWRFAVVGALCLIFSFGTDAYFKQKVACLAVSRQNLATIDWEQFQGRLDFKLARVTDSEGEKICFENRPGRAQQLSAAIQAALSTPVPAHHG